MFPDMYLQYNHPTSKSQQKPFDKNRHPHTTNTTSHSIHHSADVNSPHNASSAAPMPHHLPANHKETQPLQPSSAALMAHHPPVRPPHLTPPKKQNGQTASGAAVRSSLPPFIPPTHTKKEPPGQTPGNSPKNAKLKYPIIINRYQSLPVVTNHHPTRNRNF